MTSEYGELFDESLKTWATIEDEHDKIHPDRNECGRGRGCLMREVADNLEHDMMSGLTSWRKRRRD